MQLCQLSYRINLELVFNVREILVTNGIERMHVLMVSVKLSPVESVIANELVNN